jgi:hypothetical protein
MSEKENRIQRLYETQKHFNGNKNYPNKTNKIIKLKKEKIKLKILHNEMDYE